MKVVAKRNSSITVAKELNEEPGRIRRENQAAILKAAEALFARKGYKATSLAEIARQADLPKANVLYYFQTKENLYRFLLRDILEIWLGTLQDLKPSDNPETVITQYVRQKVEYSRTRANASKIFAMEIMAGAPVIGSYLRNELRQWVKQRGDIIRQWIAEGKIQPVDPAHFFFLVWSATQHYADFDTQITAVLNRPKLTEKDFEVISDSLVTFVLRACGIASSRRPATSP